MSKFTDRMRAVGVPCGLRFNADTITIESGDDIVSINVIVEFDRPIQSGGEIDYEGRIRVSATDIEKFSVSGEPVKAFTFDGKTYHITSDAVNEGGMYVFEVRRHEVERERSNEFDLSDEQATWQ